MLVGRPGQGLHRCLVRCELTYRTFGISDGPQTKFIIISPRGELLLVKTPLETTNLLLVGLELDLEVRISSNISV